MTGFQKFRVKNAMMLSNGIANLIGVIVVYFLTYSPESPMPAHIAAIARTLDSVFLPLAFIIGFGATFIYEQPIRRFLGMKYREEPVASDPTQKAQRRLLNEPFFLIAVDLGIWMTAACVYPTVFWIFDAGRQAMREAFFVSFHTGLITTTVAFFVFEFMLQRRVFPVFFPNGGLYAVSGIFRISIRARLIAMLFACNLIPFISILLDVRHLSTMDQDPRILLSDLTSSLYTEALIFIAVGAWLTFLVSSNLTRPLRRMTGVLRGVRKGRFEDKVVVTSNDELGYAGDVINEMTEGLKERDFIKDTFGKYVSKEIRDEILNGNVPLDGELKEVTVLFADLRDFTSMVEKTPPKEVVKIINSYFKEMDEAIQQYHGLVLQYIGDEIEAVFGAPLFRENHPTLAVLAAQEMRTRLEKVNVDLERAGYPRLSHGIGIHTGPVLAANIGSPDRLSYALVGDTVNVASRLQGLNKEFGTEIIISDATRARVNGAFPIRELPETRLKGKSGVFSIYSLG